MPASAESGKPIQIQEEDLTWVLWNQRACDLHPKICDAIAEFDPGPREAAQAAARWLRDHGLDGESQPYLALFEGALVGFYALTAGYVELSSSARKQLQLGRSTQGAYLITWIAKSARHNFDGRILFDDATGIAQELVERASATVLALDPYDKETDEMWRSNRFKMRPSRTKLPAPEGEPPLKRLYLPLRRPQL